MKVALIGVPIETERMDIFRDDLPFPIEAYSPGSTNEIRTYLAKRSKQYSTKIEDFGELKFEFSNHPDKEVFRRLKKLEERKEILLRAKENFDRVICIGPSHFGALLLYEEDDVVARFDFHGDFTEKNEEMYIGENFASYMHTVKRKIKSKRVINYGWGGIYPEDKENAMDIIGEIGVIGDNKHLGANHFDVDVDCFDKSLRIAKSRFCGRLFPEQLERMVREARPKKIGIWEYRSSYDKGEGVCFIENIVFNSS